jgi:hypothetical protein
VKAHLDIETTVSVVAKRDPARVSIRVGPVYITATTEEALALANDLADAVAVMRAAYPRDHTTATPTKEIR